MEQSLWRVISTGDAPAPTYIPWKRLGSLVAEPKESPRALGQLQACTTLCTALGKEMLLHVL